MTLENKYFVIKRDKLHKAFQYCLDLIHDSERYKPWNTGVTIHLVDETDMAEVLDEMMKFIGHDYFVMNLDEPAAQDAMERYFHYHDQDTSCGCIPERKVWCEEARRLANDINALNHWSDVGTPELNNALFAFEEHMKKAKHDQNTVPKM